MPKLVYETPNGAKVYHGDRDDIHYDERRRCWKISAGDEKGVVRYIPSEKVYYYEGHKDATNVVKLEEGP
ncbi:MAG: hypothetical protein SV253_02585 [Halobacteria archaeon]|nr:hypothetical protein [Halobacteria archaeon]